MMRKKLFLSLINYQRIQRHQLSTENARKVLGYKTKPNENEINADYIGPPDKISNIRPILRFKPENESKLQIELRLRRAEAHEWVDKFWAKHNETFLREKNDFIAKNRQAGDDNVPADKMSEFYKAFLDKNWKNHFNFNLNWYRTNFNLLLLAFRVNIEQNVKKLTGSRK